MRSLGSVLISSAVVVSACLLLQGCGGGSGDAATAAATGGSSTPTDGTTQTPAISGSPSTSATVGTAYSFQPTASGGSSLSFSAKNLPSWAAINAQSGLVSGTPASGDVGTDANIVISVSNGAASASLTAFSIAVSAVPVATGRATVSWTAPSQNSDGTPLMNLSGYQIVYGQSQSNLSQSVSVADPTATTYTISNLASGTWYFGVRATTPTSASDVSALANKTI
jgi:Putative Ig domain